MTKKKPDPRVFTLKLSPIALDHTIMVYDSTYTPVLRIRMTKDLKPLFNGQTQIKVKADLEGTRLNIKRRIDQ